MSNGWNSGSLFSLWKPVNRAIVQMHVNYGSMRPRSTHAEHRLILEFITDAHMGNTQTHMQQTHIKTIKYTYMHTSTHTHYTHTHVNIEHWCPLMTSITFLQAVALFRFKLLLFLDNVH